MTRKNTHIVAVTAQSATRVMNGADLSKQSSLTSQLVEFESGITKFPFEIDDVCVGSRDVLETDERFRQIIPYVIVERDGKFLVYERTAKGGEQRLHNKRSLGFGGHIDVSDVSLDDSGQAIDLETTVANAVEREIREELKIDGGYTFEAFGLLIDDSTPVGRVHIGIVLIAHVTGMVLSNEDQIELMGFGSVEELATQVSGSLEVWSEIILNRLIWSDIVDGKLTMKEMS
ncbi:hypothetical protein [Methylobacter sp.]